jgi:ribonuclease P/MRP protein subunit RPP1
MALEAKSLGFERIVAAHAPCGEFYGIEIYPAVLIRGTAIKDLISRIKRERTNPALVSVQAGDSGFNRAAISTRGLHIMRGIHSADKSAFDHVAAKMAADNRVAVDIDLSPLISARGITRQRAIHRYRDILVLENRYEFPVVLSSHARSVLEMRSVREIAGLCSIIGMDTTGIKKALSGIDNLITPQDAAVRVI